MASAARAVAVFENTMAANRAVRIACKVDGMVMGKTLWEGYRSPYSNRSPTGDATPGTAGGL